MLQRQVFNFMKGIEVRKMRFKEKEIVLKDGTKCILRSPNEDDAKEMIDFLKTIAEETYFLSRYPEEVITDLDKEKEIIREIDVQSVMTKSSLPVGGYSVFSHDRQKVFFHKYRNVISFRLFYLSRRHSGMQSTTAA